VAKRKSKKKNGTHREAPKWNIDVPEHARSLIMGVVLLAIASIFIFSFFDKAGAVGSLLLGTGIALVGKAVFLLPLFFVISGVVAFGFRQYAPKTLLFSLLLLITSVTGILGSLARYQESNIQELGGIIALLVSWPVYSAFGFWVAEIIFVVGAVISGILFWQLVEHEEGEPVAFAQGAKDKVKKIFEPSFEVEELEQEESHDTPEEKPKKKKEKEEQAEQIMRPLTVSGLYKFPALELLEKESGVPNAGDVKIYSAVIKKTLANFDIPVEISEVNIGPSVTQYAFKPAEGIKLSRITGLANDLSLALAAHPIRIEAPIPGRALVGIEIPNKERAQVRLRNLMDADGFKNNSASLLFGIGRDVSGSPVFADLARMPHLLVAGATGAGKTIGLNNIILSFVFRNSPDTMRLVLVDPKRVEFPVYNDLPHLLTPVIVDTQRAVNALKWAVKEMDRRFQVFSKVRVRDIGGYHALFTQHKGADMESIPYVAIVIDELADLMASRGKEIEGLIVRLAQMSRAVGIHLVLATQRPSVEVITGLIKANVTARMAFQVASQIDSRTILDSAGAEKLLGRGDLLFISSDFSKPRRIQGAYVSEKDVKHVVEWIAKESKDYVRDEIAEEELTPDLSAMTGSGDFDSDDNDPLYEEAKRVVLEARKASASLLQRRLKVGYARAARLLDILQERGVIGPGEGAKPREVYGAKPAVPGQEPEDESTSWFAP
jgi:DNA segregation ATPase FtsK/SpoIIIE, S-DNA-T family